MNQILANAFGRLTNNPHTSLAAIIWGACKLGSVWLPQYKDKFDATEAIAVSYGLLMAGDANQSAKSHEETKSLVAGLQEQLNQVKNDTAAIKKP